MRTVHLGYVLSISRLSFSVWINSLSRDLQYEANWVVWKKSLTFGFEYRDKAIVSPPQKTNSFQNQTVLSEGEYNYSCLARNGIVSHNLIGKSDAYCMSDSCA